MGCVNSIEVSYDLMFLYGVCHQTELATLRGLEEGLWIDRPKRLDRMTPS